MFSAAAAGGTKERGDIPILAIHLVHAVFDWWLIKGDYKMNGPAWQIKSSRTFLAGRLTLTQPLAGWPSVGRVWCLCVFSLQLFSKRNIQSRQAGLDLMRRASSQRAVSYSLLSAAQSRTLNQDALFAPVRRCCCCWPLFNVRACFYARDELEQFATSQLYYLQTFSCSWSALCPMKAIHSWTKTKLFWINLRISMRGRIRRKVISQQVEQF